MKKLLRKIRPPCPFYGFHLIRHDPDKPEAQPPPFLILGHNFLLDQDGNQCALITDAFSPCIYDNGEPHGPDWEKCVKHRQLASLSLVSRLRQTTTVYAKEENMSGITFEEWERRVMETS